jgi:Stage II sporulation protein E (SpoIIE)
MVGRRTASLLAFVLAALAPALPGATVKAPARNVAPASPVSEAIHLGDSVAPLNGPWKFQVGDSPIDPATNQPLWAQPDFDDSHWETVDVTPPVGTFDPIAGTSGYVPGWTARGHKAYWGYAWYRIRVRIEAHPDVKLAIAGPSDIDDAYQIFDNGSIVGSFGVFSGAQPEIYTTRPQMFPLPDGNNTGATRVIAFRVWMDAYTLTQLDDVGGFHNPPLVGVDEAISAQQHARWDELYLSYAGTFIEGVVFFLFAVVTLSLIFFDRSDHTYYWIGALMLVEAANAFVTSISTWTEWLPYIIVAPARQIVIIPLIFAGWVMVWRVWFQQRKPLWVPRVLVGLLALLMISNAIGEHFIFISLPVDHAFHIVSLITRLGIAGLLLLTVFLGIREQGLGGWLVVPSALLAVFSEFSGELQFAHIVNAWFPFGIQFSTRQLTNLLLVATLLVVLLRRLVLSLRRQREMALDVKQAQEVQQVILPETHTLVPGFDIESEYRPALQVGGDFFQIIPDSADSSLLIVAGDVTGKGLKAGMLVALLVGAIRTVAQFDPDPRILLDALNRRLLGRGEAYATCLALRIASDGDVMLANAGHISPYLNGKPIAMEGSLPLGMTDTPDFSILRFALKPGDRLMLLSDGVAEATDPNGNLFGFDRVQALLAQTSSAAQVANTAQAFGQEDDISVISVTRSAVLEPTPA